MAKAKKPTQSSKKKQAAAAARRSAFMKRAGGIVVVLAVAIVGTYMYVNSNADSYAVETNGSGKDVTRPDEAACAALNRAWTDGLCQWSQSFVAAPNSLCANPDLAYWKATPNDFCAPVSSN
jgi:hypothetical protein